jgi:fibronectin type 3 domain-containing protein
LEERRNNPMGAKMMRKAIATLIAAALIMTSGLAVFAAGSPDVGQIGQIWTYVYVKDNTIEVNWNETENATEYAVIINGKTVASGLKGTTTYTYNASANGRYDIQVIASNSSSKSKSTVSKRWVKKSKKATVKKKSKRKVKVSWKKVKNAGSYKIKIYKNGKLIKTVKAGKKATSKTIKLSSKGKYKFEVVPMYKSTQYKGARATTKTIKIK